ncbi:MAG: DUF2203 domain-containing protein [Candidatus Nanoarchaeia archaeon]
MKKKYFTLDQAQRILPHIETGVGKLIRLKRGLALMDSIQIDFEDYHYDHNLFSIQLNKKYHKLSYNFYHTLESLEASGCIVKDIDQGLVDFFSKHEGKDIFLCWRLGEKDINSWHDLESGYTERRPISQLKSQKIQK